jgi:CRISPR-associated protein Cas1
VPAPWTFTRRVSHPPDSAVNALLSLGYSLLYSRVVGVVNIVGLDPYLGCFHAPRHGHAALASDLMEEFRPLVVDALVLRLWRRRQLRPADIIETNQYGWRLQPESLKVFLTEFETRLQSRRQTPPDGDRLSYRQIIENQARHYARVLTGQDAVYRPFAAR